MGDVIRSKSAVEDIVADIRLTLANARGRGGKWKQLAEDRLGEFELLFGKVEARHKTATEEALPARATASAADDRADDVLGRIYDEIWNAVGRPASDPALAILFPGGYSYYSEGGEAEQPARMTLLAELLEAGVHPKLDPAAAQKWAVEIRSEAAALAKAIDEARQPRTLVELLQRVRTAVARAGRAQLAAYKRHLKAEGFTESEIHQVIPHRPRSEQPKSQPPTA